MKLLRVTAEGLPLFKEKLNLPFYAQQRVAEEDKADLYSLFSNIYLNPTNAFIGVNASGKTSMLKVILLALGIMNNEPINHAVTKEYWGIVKKQFLICIFIRKPEKKSAVYRQLLHLRIQRLMEMCTGSFQNHYGQRR